MVWHSLRPLERDILRRALAEFGRRYAGWEFDELFYAPETARTNYIISALGGSGPELFWGANDNLGPFVEMGVIRPLENLYQQAFLDSFLTKPLRANTWMDGRLYQIADRVGNHLCLVYNKKMVRKPPRTIDELVRFGKKFMAQHSGKITTYPLVWNYTEPFFVVPFIGGYGGWIIDENNQPTLDTEAVVRASRLIWELANVHRIIPPECDYEIANALFKDGYAAMIINGSWSWGTYIENGIDIGIARIPMIDETGLWPTPAVSPLGYSLNVNLAGQKLQIATELLQYLTCSEVQLRFAEVSGAIPSRIDAFKSPVVTENPIISASLDQLLVGRIMPPVTEMRWIWDAMRPSYQGIFTGQVTPQQAAAGMQKLALKLIKENRE
ncbi:extracellular solute-binding protein [candidate division KSB1 bacterium]|nr:extracellular solute-binding protein [candidate division KSB1 bacterium]